MTPSTPLRTATEFFYHWEKTTPDAVYLRQPVGDAFRDYTWSAVGDEARRMAAFLRSLGLPPQSNVGLVSKNCAHWIIADLAIGLAGHVSVPFYPTLTGPQFNQVLEHFREPGLTADLLRDGWLCTGDMGELTSDGYLKITGRVKDMFKTSKGEYVVPAPIEAGFASNTYVEQVCVAGASLPQPIALVVLSERGRQSDRRAVEQSLVATVQTVNPGLKHYEHLKKVVVVSESWTVNNNLLTPTMKIKRNLVENRFQPWMGPWYGRAELVVWEE